MMSTPWREVFSSSLASCAELVNVVWPLCVSSPTSAVHLIIIPCTFGRFLYSSQCTSNSTVDQPCTPPTHKMSFFAKLEKRVAAIDSHLCVGLDPHIKELFPEAANENGKREREPTEQEKCDKAFEFCKTIIDATGELLICERG